MCNPIKSSKFPSPPLSPNPTPNTPPPYPLLSVCLPQFPKSSSNPDKSYYILSEVPIHNHPSMNHNVVSSTIIILHTNRISTQQTTLFLKSFPLQSDPCSYLIRAG
ncbi:unnamed protein product (macronuclear) [Paramecium tetraurelia]|uniref:Uncharacterized protein n=1 Tax=Paramecium tetraurelia TaxID=5888 RepID=A0C4C5_PARTE|nr:uncharacterized protein GSPATT00035122001 [Paramecium tetraurelia]CAK65642.1 unnamed protein product [Paramecium tetraurelia]|eukprot:XP_001433039.1 hypothetical protein (macronuclear) [Paramecium tetraurelia strain d4-2]